MSEKDRIDETYMFCERLEQDLMKARAEIDQLSSKLNRFLIDEGTYVIDLEGIVEIQNQEIQERLKIEKVLRSLTFLFKRRWRDTKRSTWYYREIEQIEKELGSAPTTYTENTNDLNFIRGKEIIEENTKGEEDLTMDSEFIDKLNRYLHLTNQTIVDIKLPEKEREEPPQHEGWTLDKEGFLTPVELKEKKLDRAYLRGFNACKRRVAQRLRSEFNGVGYNYKGIQKIIEWLKGTGDE